MAVGVVMRYIALLVLGLVQTGLIVLSLFKPSLIDVPPKPLGLRLQYWHGLKPADLEANTPGVIIVNGFSTDCIQRFRRTPEAMDCAFEILRVDGGGTVDLKDAGGLFVMDRPAMIPDTVGPIVLKNGSFLSVQR